MDFPVGEDGRNYMRTGRGPVGLKYLIQSRGGWIRNEIYYVVDSDDIDCVVHPYIKKLTSTRNLYKFREFPTKN